MQPWNLHNYITFYHKMLGGTKYIMSHHKLVPGCNTHHCCGFIANEQMQHLCFCRNFSGPDSLISHCTTWCPDTCKENFVSASILKNALLNEPPSAFETAFFVRAAVTAFIICLNTKKERVIKAHWSLDLRVALYSRIKMLKAHTLFQICQCLILLHFAIAVLPNRIC